MKHCTLALCLSLFICAHADYSFVTFELFGPGEHDCSATTVSFNSSVAVVNLRGKSADKGFAAKPRTETGSSCEFYMQVQGPSGVNWTVNAQISLGMHMPASTDLATIKTNGFIPQQVRVTHSILFTMENSNFFFPLFSW